MTLKTQIIHRCGQLVDNLSNMNYYFNINKIRHVKMVSFWMNIKYKKYFIFIFFAYILLQLTVLSVVANNKELQLFHMDSKWKLFLYNEAKDLYCYGPGYGTWGSEAKLIAHDVDEIWGSAFRHGPVIIYRRGIEYRWVIIKGNTGKVLQGGVIFYAKQSEGYATEINVYPRKNGAEIHVSLENAPGRAYIVDIWGNCTIKKHK